MKKNIIYTLLAVSGLILLIESGAMVSLINFILVGAIPGTSYNVPSGVMLLIMITIIWIIVFRLATVRAFYSITTNRIVKRHVERKKRLPRRRYSQI